MSDMVQILTRIAKLEKQVQTLMEENRKLKSSNTLSLKASVDDGNGNMGFLATLFESAQNANSEGQRSGAICIRVGWDEGGKMMDENGNVGWINMVKVGDYFVSGFAD